MISHISIRRPRGRMHSAGRRLAPALLAALWANSAQAAFHLWVLKELYTNLDGTQQFIEFTTPSTGRTFTGSQTIEVTNQAGTMTHSYTIPAVNLNGETTNHDFLVGTTTIASASGVTPDYATLPAGFLFSGGGKIELEGAVQGFVTYAALPTDGTDSLNFSGSTTAPTETIAVNSPTDFSGATGAVVPEPSSWALLGFCGLGGCFLLRRLGAGAKS